MSHTFNQKVFYSDTDAYGVVWHGSYLRWLEMGRVLWCEQMGYSMVELENNDIILPIVNINLKYKSSAKLNDELIIETFVKKYNPLVVTFSQIVKLADGRKCVDADVDVVAIHKDGKLYRKMPEFMLDIFERELK